MNSSRITVLLGLLLLLPMMTWSQQNLRLSLGGNAASVGSGGGDSSPLLGLEIGLEGQINVEGPWYITPGIRIAQGGQKYATPDNRWGLRNTYGQLSALGGYSHSLGENGALEFELGPTVNLWARGVSFSDFSGTNERNKLDIGANEAANRIFISSAAFAGYRFDAGRFDLSLGLRANLGITPIESFELGNGEKERLRASSWGFQLGINYPLEGLKLGFKVDDTTGFEEIDPEDLITKTPFEEAFDSFKKARELVDSSYYGRNPNPLPPDIAEDALTELERTKKLLREGREAWEEGDEEGIGPEASKKLSQYILELESRAQIMADSSWIVERPEPEEEEDPRDFSPPTLYGENVDPPWISAEGAMAPSQGVWQDDDYFEDKATKQITQKTPQRWHAELDMVANRWTALFGLKGRRRSIYISGTSTYTQTVPVKFRLTLIQGGKKSVIWTEAKSRHSIPIAGVSGPERSWSVDLYQPNASPVPKTFKMKEGQYELELSLVKENGAETGIKIVAYGEVVETAMPKVHIVPVLLTDNWTNAEALELADNSRRIANECNQDLPKYFPIADGEVDVRSEAIQYLGDQELSSVDYLVSLLPLTDTEEEVREERTIARLTQRFATTAQLGGEGRVIVVINDKDFERIYRDPENVGGFAPHPKVQFMRMENYGSTVAHELIHSLPYVWSEDEMVEACGFSYHNSDDNDYGNGVEVYSFGAFYRENRNAVMGPVSLLPHITQCSYWHLIDQFQKPNDPELYLVRGFLARQNGKFYGVLSPTFEFEGDEGLAAGSPDAESWAIQLEDKEGNILTTYPFSVEWEHTENSGSKTLLAFNHRIERVSGTARIVLIGPEGEIDAQKVSDHAPNVRIRSPEEGSLKKEGGKGIKISWKASDQDGDKLVFRVLYSLNEGKNWLPLGDEIKQNSILLPSFSRPKKMKVRVYASDGVRSDMKEVNFTLFP